jgi:maltooligosyltrehalose trehalohydrolase
VQPLGALLTPSGVMFRVFATAAERVGVRLFDAKGTPRDVRPMEAVGEGVFELHVPGAGPGTLYKFVLDDRELPDPYARFLPHGVHGPAEVRVPASRYPWRSGPGIFRELSEQVIYELHLGTFTEQGTWESARARLPELAALGVTAVEIMPIGAFAGERGWGYDGVSHYAPFAPYGTPDELCAFIDGAHALGLSVFLDVVYNHFGPAGNYLGAYAREYFTSEITTPWGDALNFAHPRMRHYVIGNARYWLDEFRFDGLRLDAIHAIADRSPRHILRELADEVAGLRPRKLLIAEDDRNDPADVTSLGLDAIWADDFHHQVRVTLTGEHDGYYRAYTPGTAGIAEAINRGWLYSGQSYAPWGKPRGQPPGALPAECFVYCVQNHDQIGNRALGDRLTAGPVSLDAYSAVSMLLLFLPMTPILFMGQEWASSSPFRYFTDHAPDLGERIREGRRNEFRGFTAFTDPARRAHIPDPQAVETFLACRLDWGERGRSPHLRVHALYKHLLELRRTDPVLREASRERIAATSEGPLLVVHRWRREQARFLFVNFSAQAAALPRAGPLVLTSSGDSVQGSLPPWTAAIFAGDKG